MRGPRLSSWQRRSAPRYRLSAADALVESARFNDPEPWCVTTFQHCSECWYEKCKYRGRKP